MQILSLAGAGFLAQAAPAVAAAAPTQTFTEYAQRIIGSDWKLLVWFVLTQVVTVIAFWIASKAIVDRNEFDDEGPTFGQAIKAWFIVFIFTAVLTAVVFWSFYKTGPLIAEMAKHPGLKPNVTSDNILPFVGPLVAGLLWLLVRIFGPMRVYRLGCGGAIVFFIFSLILEIIFSFGLRLAFHETIERTFTSLVQGNTASSAPAGGSTIFQGKQQFSAQVESVAKRAADPRRPMPERQQALKDLYDALEKYRETLDVNANPVGVAEYEKQRARYEQILADLKAEVAAQRR